MSDKTITGILIIGLVIGGLLLLTRKPAGASERATSLSRRISSEANYLPVVEDAPAASRPGRRYQNTETREIEWDERRLPVKITIHRDAIVG